MAYSVFPERMDPLNKEDVTGSLGSIESYLTYMQERVEFAFTNMFKQVQGAGVSSAEMLVLIAALSNSLSGLTGTVNQLQATVTGLQTTVGQHTTQITSLQSDVGALTTTVAGHTTDIGGLQTTTTQHTADISDLDRRVTALEGGS